MLCHELDLSSVNHASGSTFCNAVLGPPHCCEAHPSCSLAVDKLLWLYTLVVRIAMITLALLFDALESKAPKERLRTSSVQLGQGQQVQLAV